MQEVVALGAVPKFGPGFVLDLDDASFIRNPLPTYSWLRSKAPVYEWAGRGLVFSRYWDVKAVYSDRRLTMDRRTWEAAAEERWPEELRGYKAVFERALFRLDPVEHARVRQLMSAAVSPRSIERLRPETRRCVEEVLDEVVAGNRLDVKVFAERFLYRVICNVLKIPEGMRDEVRAFCDASFQAAVTARSLEQLATILAPMPGWLKMVSGFMDERRRNPQENDLLSALITARNGSEQLSEADLIGLMQALIIGGLDNTAHGICYAVYTLLRYPQQLAEVRERPELLRQALDETLRFDNFVKAGVPRFCTEDMDLLGVRVRKGQMIFGFIPAAHHDPEIFPEPERFDIHRDLSRLLAFGAGQHFCLGAALARLDLEESVGTLLRRYPDMQLVSTEREFQPNPFNRTMTRLDLILG